MYVCKRIDVLCFVCLFVYLCVASAAFCINSENFYWWAFQSSNNRRVGRPVYRNYS